MQTHTTAIVGAALFWLLPSCGKLTPENYAKLEAGMRYEEVVKIIGEPTRCTSVLKARTCVWKDEEKEIDVKLIGDKVVFFSSRSL